MNDQKQTETPKPVDPCLVPKEWNILQRMNWVRSQVGYVQKDSKVQNQYKAVRHDAVTAMLRQWLIKAGIITRQTLKEAKTVDTGTTTQSGVPIIRYEAVYIITFYNVCDIGCNLSVDVASHALDHGDKAPGKAMSYAKKYAYLKEFDIETGEDEESRIEQKAAADTEAELQAIRLERVNMAISQHMDSINAIKTGIKEAGISIEKKTHQVEAIENESALSEAVIAWGELTNDEKRSLWVAPSKGGPFSTDERYIMKSTKWAELNRENLGIDEN